MDLSLLKAVWFARRAGRHRALSRKLRWVVLGLMIPMAGGFLVAGLALGSGLQSLDPTQAGRWVAGSALFLGILSGLWDGTYLLDVEPLRTFLPVPWELAVAELLLGLTTGFKAYVGSLALVFTLGLAWRHPGWGLQVLPLLLLGGVGWVCLERLVGALGRAFNRWIKYVALFVALGGLVSWVYGQAGLASVPAIPWALPAFPFLRGGWAFLPGPESWGGLLLGFIASAGILAVLTGVLVAWDLLRGASEPSGRPPRPWRFRRPWAGIAAQQWRQLWSSKLGVIRLFFPLMAVMWMKTPALLDLHSGSTWRVFSLGYFQCALSGAPLFNLFGFDRGGARTLSTLPVADGSWLAGKVAGTWAYQAGFTLLMALVLACLAPFPHALVMPALLFTQALFLIHAGVGAPLSIQLASPVDPGRLTPRSFHAARLVRIPAVFGPMMCLLLLWFLASRLGATWLLASQGLAVAVGLGVLAHGLSAAKAALASQREEMILLLEGHPPEAVFPGGGPLGF
jgi:hypothetical protein